MGKQTERLMKQCSLALGFKGQNKMTSSVIRQCLGLRELIKQSLHSVTAA